MLFSDYVKYVENTFVNHCENHKKYYTEDLQFDLPKVRGLDYRMEIQKEGSYSITIDQNDMNLQKGVDEGWGRSTILLVKDYSTRAVSDYEYIDGVLKYGE